MVVCIITALSQRFGQGFPIHRLTLCADGVFALSFPSHEGIIRK